MWHKNKAGNFGGVYMKIRFIFLALLTAAFCLVLSACFSPLSEGSATVTIGGVSGRTVVPTAVELAGMTYELTLMGGSLGTFGGTYSYGDTVSVPPGTYRILVTARNADGRIRGVLNEEETRTLTEGSNTPLTLKSAIGIKNFTEFQGALGGSYPDFVSWLDPNTLLVIENDFSLSSGLTPGAYAFTIIAEPGTTRTIRRGGGYVFTVSGGNITLGRSGESGTLIFDGEAITGNSFFTVTANTLTVNGNTTITNCYGRGAISLTGGTLNLNSGKIINNHKNLTSNSSGGGIYIENSILNFGAGPLEIGGNTVTTTGSYNAIGGGIFINAGSTVSFTPICNLRIINNQAIASDSTQYAQGGGIYTEASITFPPGVVISGNNVSGDSSTSGGGGIYKYTVPTVNVENVNFGNGNSINNEIINTHGTSLADSYNYNW
jgi:hypothetical protein